MSIPKLIFASLKAVNDNVELYAPVEVLVDTIMTITIEAEVEN
jgi:hypothetical protein